MQRPKERGQRAVAPWHIYLVVLLVTTVGGYLFGAVTHSLLGSHDYDLPGAAAGQEQHSSSGTGTSRQLRLSSTDAGAGSKGASKVDAKHKWPGDSIHSVLTSSGIPYQNFQSRIMYASYKLVQKMPGGERLTGFTRILHRTVPDVLMDEIPTFHAYPHLPECDGWCDYPVANRPWAIKMFFDAVAKNASMIQGAWVFMLEADYVWMQPTKVPGSAYDPSVPGVQFLYDYINPQHPNAAREMKKLYKGPVSDIPASGPAPVLLRTGDWLKIVPDFVKASVLMESYEDMKKGLGWVREMYAWDVAAALHKHDIPIRTEHPPNSSTIVQPPFDEGLGDACLAHYTWGALYHEGLPSKGGKQVYRWEKRDYNDQKFVIKVPSIPMPPAFKEGWTLEFDAPLTRKRHDLVVLYLGQMNKAIDSLSDLTEHWKTFQEELKVLERKRDEELPQHKKEAAEATATMLAAAKVELLGLSAESVAGQAGSSATTKSMR